MSMEKFVLLVLCIAVTRTSAQCPPCNCFPVKTIINTTLTELVANSPLNTQAASIQSKSSNISSVCLSLTNTCTPDNALTVQQNTFFNGTTSLRSSIQTTNSTGRFFVTGPTRSYYDSILGSPCTGTYVIYRCQVTGTCVTDEANVDVIVTSTRPDERTSCINAGIVIARKSFPKLQFYTLQKNATTPCQCVNNSTTCS